MKAIYSPFISRLELIRFVYSVSSLQCTLMLLTMKYAAAAYTRSRTAVVLYWVSYRILNIKYTLLFTDNGNNIPVGYLRYCCIVNLFE